MIILKLYLDKDLKTFRFQMPFLIQIKVLISVWAIGPYKRKADVLINHAIYNQSMLEKHMMPGYKYIAMARDPISWFKSAVIYFSNAVNRRLKELNHTKHNDSFVSKFWYSFALRKPAHR